MKTDTFEDGGIIPQGYAGRDGNMRPAFTFANIPDGMVSFASIFHDVDVAFSGTDDVLHWIAWNIPAKAGGIPEGNLPEGAVSGTANVGRKLLRARRARRPALPSRRLRALRAQRDARAPGQRHARRAAARDARHRRT
jgi:phosphatidylethanolamine-binding protein (PEBP) family uncharacterized protein